MSFQNKKSEPAKPIDLPVLTPEAKLKTWFPDLSNLSHQKLKSYLEELTKFNKAINLISTATLARAETVHFADSILASQLIYPALVPQKEVYDFGSGNGFPGAVLSCLYPELNVILVERDTRKAEFLKHLAAKLELPRLKTLVQSVEDLPEAVCFNAVTRGFAALHKCMLIARKPMAKSGKFFHLKGDGFATELSNVPSQLFTHWNASLLGTYKLPDTNTFETVVLTERTGD